MGKLPVDEGYAWLVCLGMFLKVNQLHVITVLLLILYSIVNLMNQNLYLSLILVTVGSIDLKNVF